MSAGFSGTACYSNSGEAAADPVAAVVEPAGSPAAPPEMPVAAEAEEMDVTGLVPVKANVTSVFYRRPAPNDPPFVEVGDQVQEDTVICLLEVMKCFRQVTAEVKGRIEKILVESNTLVEQGTVLFLIRPE